MVAACGVGIFFGVFYTLSPMTVWFGAAMALLSVCAGRGLSRRERVWVFGLLATAVSLRLLAVAGFFAFTAPGDGSFQTLIPDESYTVMRTRLLRYAALGVPLSPAEYVRHTTAFGNTGLHEVFAYAQLIFGEAPYGLRLFNATLYLTACVVLYRLARSTFGGAAALFGLAATLFLPSLFFWSISTIKEPAFYFFTVISVSAAVVAVRAGPPWKRCAAVLVCAAMIPAVDTMRDYGGLLVAGGIFMALFLLVSMRYPRALLAALVLSAAAAAYAFQSPSTEARMSETLRRGEEQLQWAFAQAVIFHIGHVHTVGWHYKLLDPEFYDRGEGGRPLSSQEQFDENASYGAMARFTMRAAASFVFVPLPWAIPSTAILAYLPEQVVWLVVVGLALLGTGAGLRHDPALTLILASVSLTLSAAIAMTAGNIGTLIRHRGVVMMLLVWLSGLGASVLLKQFAVWRARAVPGSIQESNAQCLL